MFCQNCLLEKSDAEPRQAVATAIRREGEAAGHQNGEMGFSPRETVVLIGPAQTIAQERLQSCHIHQLLPPPLLEGGPPIRGGKSWGSPKVFI